MPAVAVASTLHGQVSVYVVTDSNGVAVQAGFRISPGVVGSGVATVTLANGQSRRFPASGAYVVTGPDGASEVFPLSPPLRFQTSPWPEAVTARLQWTSPDPG